jgi:5-methylcytosine-specific restriction endonuclease McrA
VGKGRRKWCSHECVELYRSLHDWPAIRRSVFSRDHGICTACGCDADLMRRILQKSGYEGRQALRIYYRSLGYPGTERDWWEADHIVPRVRGGTNELTNLHTLCVPCHHRETARLAAERAMERHDARRTLLLKTADRT